MENGIIEQIKTYTDKIRHSKYGKKVIVWILALLIGLGLGCLGSHRINEFIDFIADAFTKIFQFIAIPTIALAIITTLAELGTKKSTGQIFRHTIVYTLLTTFAAAFVGLILYIIFTPNNIPFEVLGKNLSEAPLREYTSMSYYEHLLSLIPSNIHQTLESSNVLSVILVSAAVGLGISFAPDTENKTSLIRVFKGFQELIFTFIKALIWILPLGIIAFSAQLSAHITSGEAMGSLGKYVAIVVGSNLIQIFIILPLFLMAKKLNPIEVFTKMLPALAVAFFTKSSAATLPVTLETAEKNLNINPTISRFVLPICTTINMNGCAAFILITSLFVMQNAGFHFSIFNLFMWLLIAIFAAIGNAGVPMGCYFLTLSLMSSIGVPLGILGVILPIYPFIDMIETVENVWSDSVVCSMTDKDLAGQV